MLRIPVCNRGRKRSDGPLHPLFPTDGFALRPPPSALRFFPLLLLALVLSLPVLALLLAGSSFFAVKYAWEFWLRREQKRRRNAARMHSSRKT